LVTVLDEFEAPPTRVYGVFPARKHLPLRLRTFVDYLKVAFAAAPLASVLQAVQPPSRSRR
jgi:DNA-binding transcriptional LysR family regulator